MQVRAIIRAAVAVEQRTGDAPLVEIMHPLVGFAEEPSACELTVRTAAEDSGAHLCGTMIGYPAPVYARTRSQPRRTSSASARTIDADDARLLARRRGEEVSLPLPRRKDLATNPFRDARPGWGWRSHAHRGRARARSSPTSSSGSAESTAAIRAWPALPRARARLRELLAVSRVPLARLAAAQAAAEPA